MLFATTALSGVGLIAASLAGYGSLGLTVAVCAGLANLVGLAALVRFATRAVVRGEAAAAGLAALYGKTLILLGAVALLGGAVGAGPVALGFVLVMASFTVAAPAVAVLSPRFVEAM